jgi:hypothetical protein
MVSVGASGAVPTGGDDFAMTHVGFKAHANITYLMTRDIKLSMDAGLNYWFPIDELSTAYYGPIFGAGMCFKL